MHNGKSPYHRGAEDGWKMGLFMSAMFLLQSWGASFPPAIVAGDIMMLGVPVLAYLFLRRAYISDNRKTSFSALWMHGILIFLCGSLIMALFVYVFLRFISPGFLTEQVQAIATALSNADDASLREAGYAFSELINRNMLPSPISVSFSLLWLGGFSGAIVSMILAFFIRLKKSNRTIK